ncbi:uncharacterized protein LOC110996766 [Pieris rapae]|uniref:uncharacterized protein LOC110996766 n=1 Tax=Pieris rapae TaxID=64459 RepID=UPI001E27F0B9|nr:uncharacterized protein LOC110996766 [Pieris rapae]
MKRNNGVSLTSKTSVNKSKQITKESTVRNIRKDSNDCTVPYKNPFKLPQNMRVFSKPNKKKKEILTNYKLDEPKTICDVDESFYKIIEGRPLRQFSDIKVYMTNIRDITLFKANAAYLKDEILQMVNAKSDEMEEYENILKLYTNVRSSFISFVRNGYRNAKRSEQLCKKIEIRVCNVTEELNEYCFTYNRLKCEVDALDATFDFLSKYGEFLYDISPDIWKKSRRNMFLRASGLLRALSSDVYTPSKPSVNKYDGFITAFKTNEPQLYFKKPAQLYYIFDEISKQCLNYMQKEVFITSLKNNVLRRKDYLKKVIESESDGLKYAVDYYEKQIRFYELKEATYKAKFYTVLNNDFYNGFASYEATKMFTCLQYAHTQIIGSQEDPKDNITMLARNLEWQFIEIMSQFDDLDQTVVKMATKELFAEDREIMKRALLAQRTLKECNILTKSLYSSFEPPRRPRRQQITKKKVSMHKFLI